MVSVIALIAFNPQLQAASKNCPDDNDALRVLDLLYDAALVSSGFTVSTLAIYFLSLIICSSGLWSLFYPHPIKLVMYQTCKLYAFCKVIYDLQPNLIFVQPENPAELGSKIYEMLGMNLQGKWSVPDAAEVQHPTATQSQTSQTYEAEVVEPAEAGGQK